MAGAATGCRSYHLRPLTSDSAWAEIHHYSGKCLRDGCGVIGLREIFLKSSLIATLIFFIFAGHCFMYTFLRTRLCCLVLVTLLGTSPARAHFIEAAGQLTGPGAGTASAATGNALVQLDLDLVTMRVVIDFTGLSGNSVTANLFVPTPPSGVGDIIANVPSLLAFPAGVTSGTYDQTFDLTVAGSYNPAFITAAGGTVFDALQALHDAVEADSAFITITSTSFGGGEISGALTVVPEPASLSLFGLTAMGAVVGRAVRKRSKRRECAHR